MGIRRPDGRSYVYFIGCEGCDLVKIGHAVDPPARLKEFQTGSALRLRLIGVILESAALGSKHT